MTTLAIKGHATRGSEVIGLLEMLGGKNRIGYIGYSDDFAYFINNGEIASSVDLFDNAFTLEEFLEKFPYKLWDKVNVCGENAASVIGMRWESDYVVYRVRLEKNGYETSKIVEELQPYIEQKEKSMEERDNSVVVNNEHKQLKVHLLRHDKVQLMIDDKYELKQEGNAYYIVKKIPQYPKTYEECCKVLILKSERATFSVSGLEYERFSVVNLQRLLICRDAYWKIAGNWKPDFTNDEQEKYGVYVAKNIVTKDFRSYDVNQILTFPTEEMRDAFYEHFKQLIEECKELL